MSIGGSILEGIPAAVDSPERRWRVFKVPNAIISADSGAPTRIFDVILPCVMLSCFAIGRRQTGGVDSLHVPRPLCAFPHRQHIEGMNTPIWDLRVRRMLASKSSQLVQATQPPFFW